MIEVLGGEPLPEFKFWKVQIDDYEKAVQDAKEAFYSRAYFRENFHTAHTARKLEGDWFAKWTDLRDDGTEVVFEFDTLFVWTTEKRIRMVGASYKDIVTGKTITSVPMEGVVSWNGRVALSYWSPDDISMCGTVLLKSIGARLDLLAGTWEGFTGKTLDQEPRLVHGRVVMARTKDVADRYFAFASPASQAKQAHSE